MKINCWNQITGTNIARVHSSPTVRRLLVSHSFLLQAGLKLIISEDQARFCCVSEYSFPRTNPNCIMHAPEYAKCFLAYRLSLTVMGVVFLNLSKRVMAPYRFRHGRFLPDPFTFTIPQSPYHSTQCTINP
jgi:hypothetical protein